MKISFKIEKIKDLFKVIYSFFSKQLNALKWNKKLLSIAGYSLLFIFSFLISFFLTLPFEEIKNRIIYEVSSRGYGRLAIDELSYSFPSGVKFKNLSFSKYAGDMRVEFLKAEELKIRQSIFSLILGRLNVRIKGKLYNGYASGSFKVKDKKKKINIVFEDLQIGEYTPLKELLGNQVTGKLDGQLVLDGDINNLRETLGNMELKISNFYLPGSDLMRFVKIPELKVQSLQGNFKLENGRFIIENVNLQGGDIEGSISGDVVLRYPLATSLLNLTMRIKFSDSMYESIKNLIEPLNLKKDSNGYFMMNIGGAIVFPRLR